ncbi:MAG: glycosyltransferase family 2 protein [Candidatus Abyssobacteria bacterium SURF_17]|uniref:Glycosyltransferase family 2 protein n=1 Tax=Candidatus Abyssobacteria bacterium SURF_17 TaxID=2093361 RepID=A0A419EQ43_9BACT|nr:MAG: glycosyltransferase family 2 protein [Candidatus Abyssubacteria bacterium SURF_17]
MTTFLVAFAVAFNYFIGIYYGIVNLIYTAFLATALGAILRHVERIKYSAAGDLRMSPETPPISVLIPAYNEQVTINAAVKSALSMNYPFFDVIIINDGSTDGTLKELIDVYDLMKIDLVYRDVIKTKAVRGFYYNPQVPNLMVIDKERGGKADALNSGVNMCQSPYFCSVDADSVLERDALLRLISPVLESTVPVIACGGVVRTLNGATIKDGVIERIGLPKSVLAMFQIVEYLRAFLFGRVGLDSVNAILILSGAFSLFNKASVIEVGGYSLNNVTEDMELIVRLHRHNAKNRRQYRIRFISDPICWTEVPETFKMLGRQRRRWHLGLLQSILQHKSLVFNPAYGRLGMFVMPYYLFVEVLSPVVEVIGYLVVVLSYLIGIISVEFFLLFLTLAIFYGTLLSTAGVFLEELTYRRYPEWSHMFKLLLFGFLENFGYRQLNSIWRVQAIFKYVVGQREWEYVRRRRES